MTVLQALDRYYDRMAARGDVVAPGWSTEPIGVVLELGEDGAILAVERWLDPKGKGRLERVPKWFSRSGTGSTPNFLWDNAAYVLGLGTKDPGKTARDHAAFKALHLRELADEIDPGLVALRRFLEGWTPADGAPPDYDDKMLPLNIAFRRRGETRLLHDRPAVAIHVERLRTAGAAAPEGFCLVRGVRLPLVRLHPKVKGVDGAASAEIPLVSFNNDAFASYGKDQGYNAPTSQAAAFRYGAALSALLQRGGPNRLRIGDASVAFWADASACDAAVAEQCARAVEGVFAGAFDDTPAPQGTTDEQQAHSVRGALEKVAKARAEAGVRPDLLENVPFYVLGLAPNVARIAIRYWLSSSFKNFAEALDDHAEAARIEPLPLGWRVKPPSVQRLLLALFVPKGTKEPLKYLEKNFPGLSADTTRAILSGASYPRTLLTSTVTRLRAGDDPGRGWHAAAIKACLNRPLQRAIWEARRRNTESQSIAKLEKEKLPVALDPQREDPAYQLGRLFYIVVSAQREALGRVNSSIADRYYGAASATPARVFATLLRGLRVHVSDANKRNKGWWIDDAVAKVMAKLPPELPRSLKLEEQGRFAVGYYHERGFRPPKSDGEAPNPDDRETTP